MVTNREDLGSFSTYNLSGMNNRVEELEDSWNKEIAKAKEYKKIGKQGKTYVISDIISLCFVPGYRDEFRCLVMIDGEKSGNLTKSAVNEFKFNAISISTARLLLELIDRMHESWSAYINYASEHHVWKHAVSNAKHRLDSALKERIELEEARCKYMGKKVSVCSEELASIVTGVISDVYVSYHHDLYVRISDEDNDYYCNICEL